MNNLLSTKLATTAGTSISAVKQNTRALELLESIGGVPRRVRKLRLAL